MARAKLGEYRVCPTCGNEFYAKRAYIIRGWLKYCSRLDINNGRTLCIECDKKIAFNYERDKHKYLKTA